LSHNISSENSKKSIKDILDDIYGSSSSAYYEQVIEGMNISKLFRKKEHDENNFIQNVLSIPQKAFIKCEYVKCGKPNCDQDHDPITMVIGRMTKLKNSEKSILGNYDLIIF
jgi:hypothetical protein